MEAFMKAISSLVKQKGETFEERVMRSLEMMAEAIDRFRDEVEREVTALEKEVKMLSKENASLKAEIRMVNRRLP